MLTWGFEGEAARWVCIVAGSKIHQWNLQILKAKTFFGRLGAKAKRKALARRRGEAYASETSSSSSNESQVSGYGDISTSDEEYKRIIAPDDDDDAGEKRTQDIYMAKIEDSRISSLESRMRAIEESMAMTNAKLDLILQKLDRTR